MEDINKMLKEAASYSSEYSSMDIRKALCCEWCAGKGEGEVNGKMEMCSECNVGGDGSKGTGLVPIGDFDDLLDKIMEVSEARS